MFFRELEPVLIRRKLYVFCLVLDVLLLIRSRLHQADLLWQAYHHISMRHTSTVPHFVVIYIQ